MKKLILAIATISCFVSCSKREQQSASTQDMKPGTVDSIEYIDQQKHKADSLEALKYDTTILQDSRGPAMTPLGDVTPKQHVSVKH